MFHLRSRLLFADSWGIYVVTLDAAFGKSVFLLVHKELVVLRISALVIVLKLSLYLWHHRFLVGLRGLDLLILMRSFSASNWGRLWKSIPGYVLKFLTEVLHLDCITMKWIWFLWRPPGDVPVCNLLGWYWNPVLRCRNRSLYRIVVGVVFFRFCFPGRVYLSYFVDLCPQFPSRSSHWSRLLSLQFHGYGAYPEFIQVESSMILLSSNALLVDK